MSLWFHVKILNYLLSSPLSFSCLCLFRCFSLSVTPPPQSLFHFTAGVQRVDLFMHEYSGCVHPLPSRGFPEAGLPGDPWVHPGSPSLPEGEPAAGESLGQRMLDMAKWSRAMYFSSVLFLCSIFSSRKFYRLLQSCKQKRCLNILFCSRTTFTTVRY